MPGRRRRTAIIMFLFTHFIVLSPCGYIILNIILRINIYTRTMRAAPSVVTPAPSRKDVIPQKKMCVYFDRNVFL